LYGWYSSYSVYQLSTTGCATCWIDGRRMGVTLRFRPEALKYVFVGEQ